MRCRGSGRAGAQVQRALDTTRGGSASASLDEVVAKLARARVLHACLPPAAAALTRWSSAHAFLYALSRQLQESS